MKAMFKGVVFAAAAIAASGSAMSAVTCRVEPDYAVRQAEKPGEAYVKVTLAADKVAAKSRPSVNLAIVLDRSGSMHGDKMVKAREAACEAIDRLEERDIVSVVAYDDVVETVIPAQHVTEKAALKAKIAAIGARGSTALFSGVAAGAAELKKFRAQCEISRVLLLSDGQANVGPSSAEELGRYGALLMKDGVAVSTVGLGVDYNEDLMTRLSQKSDGNSYFVEKSEDLPRIFAGELGDVLSVAATKVQLKVRFGEGFVPVQLVGRDGRIADGVVSIDLNQLYGGQEKYVIIKCDAAPGKVGSAREIATAEANFFNPVDEKDQKVTGVASVTYSSDLAAVKASVNKSVVKETVFNENALRLEEAIRFADKGDFEAAQRAISVNAAAVREIQADLDLGDDAELNAELKSQVEVIGGSFRRGNYSSRARKGVKARTFEKLNQQQNSSW